MAVFIAAASPLLILLAQRSGLRGDRHQTQLIPQVDVNAIPCSNELQPHDSIKSGHQHRTTGGNFSKRSPGPR